jgi:hypothetical protein
MEALEGLGAAREMEAAMAAEALSAESGYANIQGELGCLKGRLAEREREVAKTGAPLPIDPFPEEAEIARVDRQRRVVVARLELSRGRLRAAQQDTEDRKTTLRTAWHEFGREEYGRAIAQYREAALGLRSMYAVLTAWRSLFPREAAGKFPNPGHIAIEDPLGRRIIDRWLIHCEDFGDTTWKPLAGDLYAALCEMQSQVERAQAGEPARVLEKENGEQK